MADAIRVRRREYSCSPHLASSVSSLTAQLLTIPGAVTGFKEVSAARALNVQQPSDNTSMVWAGGAVEQPTITRRTRLVPDTYSPITCL